MPIPEDIDEDKLAEIGLAILWLSSYGEGNQTRAWKNIDWDLTDLLFEKGWITNPKSKAKSVFLTEEGKALAAKYFDKHFKRESQ